MSGFVYFLRCAGYVKIGWSKVPELRLRTLRTGLPFTVDVLGVHPGTKADERALHRRFSSLRHRGEWFVASEEIVNIARAGFVPVVVEIGASGFRDIIALWPSVDTLAAEIGAKVETVRKWRQRNSIPAEWWLRIIEAAEKRGFDLTAEKMTIAIEREPRAGSSAELHSTS